jgi:allantoicase
MTQNTSPSFTTLTDLAAERLGGKVLSCSDDFFAEKENLIKSGRGIFIANKYTDRGKWMDGWESRRKRTPGNDWCILKLATTGRIKGIDIDTNHFLGNHPPFASVEAAIESDENNQKPENLRWIEIVPRSPLQPGSQNFFEVTNTTIFSHIRLNIFPDGGVARLKVYGDVFKDWSKLKNMEVDLAAATNGARAIKCNDMFFSHMNNLIMPERGLNMGDGWETKRNRTPGNKDWVIVRLAHSGNINNIVVDTCHFKGNYPDSCMIEGCTIKLSDESKIENDESLWKIVLAQVKLSADKEHFFKDEILNKGPFTHVRLTIFPDGGISRLRLFGTILDL